MQVHRILLYKSYDALMHMYRIVKVYMLQYFRADLSQPMSLMRVTIAQEIHNIYSQREVRNSPLFFLIYRKMYKIFYFSSKYDDFSTGFSLPWNGPWCLGWVVVLATMWNILTAVISSFIFTDKEKSRGGLNQNPKNPVILPVNALEMYIF